MRATRLQTSPDCALTFKYSSISRLIRSRRAARSSASDGIRACYREYWKTPTRRLAAAERRRGPTACSKLGSQSNRRRALLLGGSTTANLGGLAADLLETPFN